MRTNFGICCCCSVWPVETDNPYLAKMTTRVEHITRLLASSEKGQSDRFMVRLVQS